MTSSAAAGPAVPEIVAQAWLNTPQPLTLAGLRGQVVALHAFQMLCPGCVLHGIPQAQRMQRLLGPAGLRVIGLHSVFEHHAVMGRPALEVFIHEYRLQFPIAIDQPGHDGDPIPLTMRALGLQGTPSLLLIDRQGRLRQHHFGQVDDMLVGAQTAQLLAES